MEWLAAIVAFLGLLACAPDARAAVQRFALVIGNNRGDATDVELRYAEDDALRIYDVLKDLGGFEPADMVLLRGEDPQRAEATLIALNDHVRLLRDVSAYMTASSPRLGLVHSHTEGVVTAEGLATPLDPRGRLTFPHTPAIAVGTRRALTPRRCWPTRASHRAEATPHSTKLAAFSGSGDPPESTSQNAE